MSDRARSVAYNLGAAFIAIGCLLSVYYPSIGSLVAGVGGTVVVATAYLGFSQRLSAIEEKLEKESTDDDSTN